MDKQLLCVPIVVILAIVAVQSTQSALAQPLFPFVGSGNYSFGPIASIQNDATGNPAWVVSGNWKGNILNFTQGDNNSTENVVFSANVNMVTLNGTGTHSHSITNFKLTNLTKQDDTTTLNGTSTIKLKEGPVPDVPTVIKIFGNKVISISLDQSKVHAHYGNTPIYGIVQK